MHQSYIGSVPFSCQILQLEVFAQKPDGATNMLLKADEPFSIQVTVEFGGAGAIALLALTPILKVEFYANSIGPGEDLALGDTTAEVTPNAALYTPVLALNPPQQMGMAIGKIYRIGALVKVGAPNFPAFIHGFVEDPIVEIYSSPNGAKKSKNRTN